MEIKFSKYEGAGNDFILLDNRDKKYSTLKKKNRAHLCDRHFGVGADGLIMLSKNKEGMLVMNYYNADGGLGSMCGNGSRCFVLFARRLNLVDKKMSFLAYDGIHHATVLQEKNNSGIFRISMSDVAEIKKVNNDWYLNTGSPHYVTFRKKPGSLDVFKEGKKIRNSSKYRKVGTNVNFAEVVNTQINMRTYERGVEDETLACGTGITATALAAHVAGLIPNKQNKVRVKAVGGVLKVDFKQNGMAYSDIFLTGPARFVFEGIAKI